MLTRIIQARLEEIFAEVRNPATASGFDIAAGRRAVLTGGACQLAGTRELAARTLNKQVRIGRPAAFPGLAAASAGPDYATAIGLLMAGATMPPELLNPEPAKEVKPAAAAPEAPAAPETKSEPKPASVVPLAKEKKPRMLPGIIKQFNPLAYLPKRQPGARAARGASVVWTAVQGELSLERCGCSGTS